MLPGSRLVDPTVPCIVECESCLAAPGTVLVLLAPEPGPESMRGEPIAFLTCGACADAAR